MKRYLAFDFGAESGRAIVGTLDQCRLTLEEIHRFPNVTVRLDTGLHWDALRLFHEIQRGLHIAGRERGLRIDGIGVDTWGVDFGLLGPDGSLLDNPRVYRDARNDGSVEKICNAAGKEFIFRNSGIQFMQINSLNQLYVTNELGSPALAAASRLLFMPDLFNYWLSGVQRAEVTIASTSQFYNPVEKRWATEVLTKLGLPSKILPEIIQPGEKLGPLLPWLAADNNLEGAMVYAAAGHDTASAVVAVPAEPGDDWCYISSGTWSLMGVEIDQPIVNDAALALTLTNEIGYGGKVRLLKNIMGLWLVQECRRAWMAAGQTYSYEELTNMAEAAKPATALIDVDAFLHPGNMPAKIESWCKDHGQQVPDSPGQMIRVILESLAERYRQVLESIEALTGRKIKVIHIVGGGSQNKLLNRLVALRTGRRVVSGPIEATAIGNILVQALGAGEIPSLSAARQIVRSSFEVTNI